MKEELKKLRAQFAHAYLADLIRRARGDWELKEYDPQGPAPVDAEACELVEA